MRKLTNNLTKTYYRNRNADDKQAELYKQFPQGSFMNNPKNTDHVLQWITFFRRNLHRFAMDYLQIKLYLYQIIILYLCGINQFFVIIASRASAKSFIIALYACCKCILYPNSEIVLASGTRKQAKLLVSEKIEKELMSMSPMLRQEIKKIQNNQNEVIVYFKNHSTITVVTANENGRGYRSTVIVREEFRQIKKQVDDGILSPFQIVRQVPCLKDTYYEKIEDLKEEPTDIYISSSWIDNGHWMWNIVDQSYKGMMNEQPSCLLAFDESIALKHGIKTQKYYQTEKKKQDSLTWRIEFMNERVKENKYSYFSYSMLQQNQRLKKPFYPRTLLDYKTGKKNPHDISRQKGEIRIVACDMAFVENEKNDNSIFSCMRLLPESSTFSSNSTNRDTVVDNGYRRQVPYMEAVQGGDTFKQALRIRQLYEDFDADYIVLDMRNAGISIYDLLAKVMYDEERDCEYSPLKCMNDESIANRIKINGAKPCIFAVVASQKLNSEIATDFRRVLESQMVDLLISFELALEDVLPNNKDYVEAAEAETQSFYELPFLETQELINESTGLTYEKHPQTGAIIIREQGSNRKDRYTSVSYGSYFSSLLEKDILTNGKDYDYCVFFD